MSQNQIKDIFKDTFHTFEKKGEENVDVFVLNELTSIYDDKDKAKEVADEINSFFDRIDENMKEIKEGKEKSVSTARWFQNKLDDYQVIAKDLPQELLGRLTEVNNESIGDLINEPFIREVDTIEYESIGKKIVSSKIIDLVKEDANIGIINNEITFDSLGEIVDTEIKSIKKYFDVEIDSPFDKSIKKVGTVAALKVQKTGNFKPFNDKSPTELAAIVDNTFTVAKVGYKIATGEIRASDATDYLIDRGAARLEAVVNQTCVKYGAMAGAKIGGVVGSVFGPAGTVVGTAIGKTVGAMAGQYVATKIGEGTKKIATKAKEVVGNVANKIGTTISNVGSSISSGIKSVLGW